MKKGWFAKAGMVLGVIASCMVIGNGVSSWVNKEAPEENTNTETAAVEYVVGV